MINVFYVTPTTSRSEQLLLTLPGNLGLVSGACALIAFGSVFKHWKWTLGKLLNEASKHLSDSRIVGSWALMLIFGGLMALVTPYNKGMMIAVINVV